MQLFEREKKYSESMGSLSLLLSLPLGLTLALIGAITTSLNSLGKGVGKGLQEINKTTASSARS